MLRLSPPYGLGRGIIGVPILIAVVTLCEQHAFSRWIAQLLGGAEPQPASGASR
ncbi:MAG: hypothetical protein JO328_19710 [Hyphomicrobiales bacterium]|nr:hypothetical protein [Hyphomicrobiales bacterium]MBV8823399.1 hypothetical protein [Hyphomicrobiales bacterium]MBV9426678.1 hypothetical protein [Bradyrhizobiaceae bacterium]